MKPFGYGTALFICAEGDIKESNRGVCLTNLLLKLDGSREKTNSLRKASETGLCSSFSEEMSSSDKTTNLWHPHKSLLRANVVYKLVVASCFNLNQTSLRAATCLFSKDADWFNHVPSS